MTAEQRIKLHILREAMELNEDLRWDRELNESNIDEAYSMVLIDAGSHWDFESEFRCSGVDTNLPGPYSRYYESKEVARMLSDGTWVGWTSGMVEESTANLNRLTGCPMPMISMLRTREGCRRSAIHQRKRCP